MRAASWSPHRHRRTLAEAEDLATVVATARVQACAAKVAAAMVSAVCGWETVEQGKGSEAGAQGGPREGQERPGY